MDWSINYSPDFSAEVGVMAGRNYLSLSFKPVL
jgi:hypothetical protein